MKIFGRWAGILLRSASGATSPAASRTGVRTDRFSVWRIGNSLGARGIGPLFVPQHVAIVRALSPANPVQPASEPRSRAAGTESSANLAVVWWAHTVRRLTVTLRSPALPHRLRALPHGDIRERRVVCRRRSARRVEMLVAGHGGRALQPLRCCRRMRRSDRAAATDDTAASRCRQGPRRSVMARGGRGAWPGGWLPAPDSCWSR